MDEKSHTREQISPELSSCCTTASGTFTRISSRDDLPGRVARTARARGLRAGARGRARAARRLSQNACGRLGRLGFPPTKIESAYAVVTNVPGASLDSSTSKGSGVGSGREATTIATALGYSIRVEGPPRHLPGHRRQARAVATQTRWLGHTAAHHDWAAVRSAQVGDGGLLQGRTRSRHAGDERLGRGRASLVAESAGESRGKRS
jgi:hypothetical protein